MNAFRFDSPSVPAQDPGPMISGALLAHDDDNEKGPRGEHRPAPTWIS